MKNVNKFLKEVLTEVNPPQEDLDLINKFLKNFLDSFGKKLKKEKIIAEVFVGGSFAKKTLIKKGQYDIDVFIRFDKKNNEKEISDITEKILMSIEDEEKILRIHGSRDYFRVDADPSFFFEVIPVMKVKNPKEAENITDLSYFHVDYIKKKLKTEKMLEEVRLAKAFCHANKCYGAESYINGFSGYALELLIYHYKSFLGFVKGISKIKNKEIIDLEKLYKNRSEIIMNMNSAKMNSPIVLIDPTYKERNALAALSEETFENFKEVCKKFLKNPSKESFIAKKINFEKVREMAKKRKKEFIFMIARTEKQEGDVAGSKLAKFYRHLGEEISKLYKINDKGFDYGGKKDAEYFFIVQNKGEIIIGGPDKKDKENVLSFKNKHKNTFVKGNKIFAREKIKKDIKEFIEEWKLKNQEKIKEMEISELEFNN
ncbi:CCA-adding enzyme [uncultured archaeon]|nr:CCA-adding enzyme [uncultured archaeon]